MSKPTLQYKTDKTNLGHKDPDGNRYPHMRLCAHGTILVPWMAIGDHTWPRLVLSICYFTSQRNCPKTDFDCVEDLFFRGGI